MPKAKRPHSYFGMESSLLATNRILIVVLVLFWLWAILFWTVYFTSIRPGNEQNQHSKSLVQEGASSSVR